ncbi:helix-turn-helix domain-containing protein [Gordonia amarae]|uniref:Helix-turn-helix domain-containing protein n=2 Tax=Gordonia amarae TaxID=36821 RepID=A0A857KMK8_9ACTN|nr:XRE family transcriptional regulator [Gordonia amarae]MCS3880031.1 transcriptional regulator with XRE-family HTH domain [Gordonia amarae]QHN18412.1 helix-turn-helix domain-containing protein [Gordonia amarae]QHN22894.1 helix-turn-helix domain-containing protein [Gordonia amarae]QHN31797.1 helix-turn-helix domain-containing protein [Gordonia amarae]QHN40543.1 helix-turn-helix domain-containing protein [Gordonia amarae]
MTQDADVDRLVRLRIRALRLARGWSLDTLAERAYLSPSNLSRIETGARRIALDQLVAIARALDATIDQLVESPEDEDVVIRPHRDERRGMTTWTLTSSRTPGGLTVAKMLITTPPPPLDEAGVHPGRDWFTVLRGTAALRLGERIIVVEAGNAAEFSTMVPHAIGAHGPDPVEILTILTAEGRHAHEQD